MKGEIMKTLFVLGGNDGEMAVIKSLLNMAGKFTIQPKKEWGLHYYSPPNVGIEVRVVVGNFKKYYYAGTPLDEVVFIECYPTAGEWVQTPNLRINISVIDHHGGDSWESASVMQVLREYCQDVKISDQLRRNIELAAANDSGYIPAMENLFASSQEIATIRLADRRAQGITVDQEKEAETAISQANKIGRLTIVRMSHSKTAPVADRLYGQVDQLLIISDDEINFFGDGELCVELKKEFPEAPAPWDHNIMAESWNGGAGLGQAGSSAFWGGYSNPEEVALFIQKKINL
jgi:hypothetical protein